MREKFLQYRIGRNLLEAAFCQAKQRTLSVRVSNIQGQIRLLLFRLSGIDPQITAAQLMTKHVIDELLLRRNNRA